MTIRSLSYTCFGLFTSLACAVSFAEEADTFDAAKTYQDTCYACHGTGAAHAPEVGDVIEWEIRLEKGLDALVQNSINGLNGIMPPRGLCTTCSDENMKALVEFMLKNSQ
jgi:cytochrome c5